MKKKFILCGTLGWCMEILFTGLHSFFSKDYTLAGRTSIWMFPIYGMACIFSPLSQKLKTKNTLLRGSIYTCLLYTSYTSFTGISPVTAEEICFLSSIDSRLPASELSADVCVHFYNPVSYTHLDVYKRQPWNIHQRCCDQAACAGFRCSDCHFVFSKQFHHTLFQCCLLYTSRCV